MGLGGGENPLCHRDLTFVGIRPGPDRKRQPIQRCWRSSLQLARECFGLKALMVEEFTEQAHGTALVEHSCYGQIRPHVSHGGFRIVVVQCDLYRVDVGGAESRIEDDRAVECGASVTPRVAVQEPEM